MMVVDPRCKRLIDGFSGGYRFVERGNTGMHADTPEKNLHSHLQDALQYLALDLFGYSEFNARIFTDPLEQRGIVNA
jgi:hypothetical protein